MPEPANIQCAQHIPAALLRTARDGYAHEWRRTVPRIPCERLTVDFVFAPGVYDQSSLSVSDSLYRGEAPVCPAGDAPAAEQFRPSAEMYDVEGGVEGLAIPGCDRYEEAVGMLAASAGLDPSACRIVRVAKEYPVLNSELVCWIPLPATQTKSRGGTDV